MKRIIVTENAPKAVASYNQAVEANNMLFVSGQIAIDPSTGKLVDGGIKEQTERVLQNLKAILEAAGYSLNDVVKTTCMISDMDNFQAMNEVYSRFFFENAPARASFGTNRLPLNALIEIDAVAVR